MNIEKIEKKCYIYCEINNDKERNGKPLQKVNAGPSIQIDGQGNLGTQSRAPFLKKKGRQAAETKAFSGVLS